MNDMPTRWKPKNVHEELWNIVDLHLINSTSGPVVIDVHAVETGADDSTEETGRCLLTVRANIPSPMALDLWHSSWDLGEFIREAGVPPLTANLLNYAADMGLAIVRGPGMGFNGREEEQSIPTDVVEAAEESEEQQVARLVDEYGTVPAFGHPETPC